MLDREIQQVTAYKDQPLTSNLSNWYQRTRFYRSAIKRGDAYSNTDDESQKEDLDDSTQIIMLTNEQLQTLR